MERMMYRIMDNENYDLDYYFCEECMDEMRDSEQVIDRVPDIVCQVVCDSCGYDINDDEDDEYWDIESEEDDNIMSQ